MSTIGEALIEHLVARNVTVVFGIPGVHTVELYRGLATSGIRHITPRHEQGAGFMADGYARVSGKPGVALVITGPGLTNTLTAMAQARADSVPMLVLSGVNALANLGKGLGLLHELPDQQALARCVALTSDRVENPGDLAPMLDRVFAAFATGRPGPAHIEIPLDVAGHESTAPVTVAAAPVPPEADPEMLARAADLLGAAKQPVILAGGGTRGAVPELQRLAECLDAPVVLTVNARGAMHGHPLTVPASPSLNAVRQLIENADLVLALGTEIGETDYGFNQADIHPKFETLIRVDICPCQLMQPKAQLAIHADVRPTIGTLLDLLAIGGNRGGAERAAATREQALAGLNSQTRHWIGLLDALREAAPAAIMVGDSTQLIYAGNTYYDHDRVGGWFNAATGFGALGYAVPAAIGAALAAPDAPVLCLVGDGGAQFTLSELMVAKDENLSIVFIVWNNQGYQEIATWMRKADVAVIGCDPTPPDFSDIAAACGMPFERCDATAEDLSAAVTRAIAHQGPVLVEVDVEAS